MFYFLEFLTTLAKWLILRVIVNWLVFFLWTEWLKRTYTKSKSTNRRCSVNHKAQRLIAFTPMGNQIGPGAVWSESNLLRYRTSVLIKMLVQGTWTCWFKYANRLWGHRILYLGDFKWQPIQTINIKYFNLVRYYHSSYVYVDTKHVKRYTEGKVLANMCSWCTKTPFYSFVSCTWIDSCGNCDAQTVIMTCLLWCTDSHYDMLIVVHRQSLWHAYFRLCRFSLVNIVATILLTFNSFVYSVTDDVIYS